MSRVGNIFELLSDENDEGGARAAVANAEPSQPKKQEQSKGKVAAPQKTQRNERPADNKARENRPPRANDTRRQAPRDAAAGGEGAQVDKNFNRPPRQQREGREGFERRSKNLERAPEDQEGKPRKRVFDRKSGTGHGPRDNVKRGGGGKGNWGTVEDDQKAQTEQGAEKTEGTEETPAQPTEKKVEGEKPAEEQAPEEPKEDEDAKLKTLDEYYKSLAKPTLSLPPPRQVEAKPEWASYVAVNRDLGEDNKPKDKKKEEKDQSKKQISADQIISFAESPKPFENRTRGGGRGGRGGRGGAGRGGRGGARGGATGPAPNFKDEKSFPSLGGQTKA